MPDESEVPRTPTTLGVVLHIMERNHDVLVGQLGEVRRDVGDLRETVGELSGGLTAHYKAHESPITVAAPHVDAGNGETADDVKFLARVVGTVKRRWKIAATIVGLLGLGHGSTYVIPGCGKTVHIHDTVSASPDATPTSAMPPAASIVPSSRHRTATP